jgi:hypothetical protein
MTKLGQVVGNLVKRLKQSISILNTIFYIRFKYLKIGFFLVFIL